MMHLRTSRAVALAAAISAACADPLDSNPEDRLLAGTWGGASAGVIVSDSTAHVHINCTFGNFAVPVTVDTRGRFSVPGSYLLRAYPVVHGPELPAQFSGEIDGSRLTLTVAVNDTVEKKTVQLGPVVVRLGVEPRLDICPICRREN